MGIKPKGYRELGKDVSSGGRVQQIGVAISTCCRFKWLAQSIPTYLRNPLVKEVVVTDDCRSDVPALNALILHNASFTAPELAKLVLVANPARLYPFRNKIAAVSHAVRSEWVAVLDSDNYAPLDSYFEVLFRYWQDREGGRPKHGSIFSPDRWLSARARRDQPYYTTDAAGFREACTQEAILLNAGNQVVHRATALHAWQKVASTRYGYTAGLEGHESVLLNSLMLSAGSRLQVVKGMTYNHRMTEDSFYKTSTAHRQRSGLEHKCQFVNHADGAITDYPYGGR